MSYKNNKFNISASTRNEEFELPDGSNCISDVQDYFEYILKKTREKTDNSAIRIHVNKIQNIITFKIKTGHYLELLTPETMKLFGNTKSKITKNKIGEIVPNLEITETVSVHCNIVTIITINKIQESCIHLFEISHLVNYQIFHPKLLYF